jgi:hypothetical protein
VSACLSWVHNFPWTTVTWDEVAAFSANSLPPFFRKSGCGPSPFRYISRARLPKPVNSRHQQLNYKVIEAQEQERGEKRVYEQFHATWVFISHGDLLIA